MNPKETYRWQVQLSAEQRRELQNARDHHPKPYVRERSAALLQMAEGKSPHWVATHGVLKPRKPDTLYRWVRQDALYLHRDAGDGNTFQQPLHAFLEQFASRVQPKCLRMSACLETAC